MQSENKGGSRKAFDQRYSTKIESSKRYQASPKKVFTVGDDIMELSKKFIQLRNSIFNKKERDYIRLALIKMQSEWIQDGYSPDQITRLERLIQKFSDGKNFK
jgi:hypothetical protein